MSEISTTNMRKSNAVTFMRESNQTAAHDLANISIQQSKGVYVSNMEAAQEHVPERQIGAGRDDAPFCVP